MPFCPACKYEYVAGISRCPSCDVELVDRIDVPEEKFTDEEIVSVFESNSLIETEIVIDMLKASGIAVVEQPGMTLYGGSMDVAQDSSIYVFKSQADEALKLIAESGTDIGE